MKMYFRQAVRKQVVDAKGFLLMETILTVGLIAAVLLWLLPAVGAFDRTDSELQTKNFSYSVAADVRRMQVVNFYRLRDNYTLNFQAAKERYYITKNNMLLETVNLTERLAPDGHIRAVNVQNIFYARGSVNAYNYVNIYKADKQDGGYQIQILPVTGRVGVYKR